MTGILNKKERVLDYNTTCNDSKNKSEALKIAFGVDNNEVCVGVSDKFAFYYKELFDNVPVFESLGMASEIIDGGGKFVDWDGDFGFVMLNSSSVDNAIKKGFDFYNVNSSSLSSCIDDSFVVSSVYNKLKGHFNLLTEQLKDRNKSLVLSSDLLEFNFDDAVFDIGKNVDYDSLSDKASINYIMASDLYSFNGVFNNYAFLPPLGIDYSDSGYSSFEDKKSEQSFYNIFDNNTPKVVNFENTSENNNCIISFFRNKQASDSDISTVSNIDKLDFVNVGNGVYVVGKFIVDADIDSVSKESNYNDYVGLLDYYYNGNDVYIDSPGFDAPGALIKFIKYFIVEFF